MLLTNTHIVMYKTEAGNVCEDLLKIKDLFDFSNYPKDLKYYTNVDNLVVSKMKDKTCVMPIKGFMRLKSKRNTFITESHYEFKKVKGINKNDELKNKDYKIFLFSSSYMRHE